MKILHTLDSLNRGGAEMLTLDVCRNASNAGFEMTFVATGGGDLEDEFKSSGPEFIRLDRRFPIDPFLVRALRKIILDRDIQVVHAQQAVEAIHLYFATRGTGVKCVISLQAYILDQKNRLATKWIVPRMDRVCPVSESMQEWYRTGESFTITDRYRVLHNGVDPNRLQPTRDVNSRTLRAELGIADDEFLMAMVGNFYPDRRKDQLTICRALTTIFREVSNARFVFVGAAHAGAEDYFKKCKAVCTEAGIESRVNFVGKRSDIVDILGEIDLFIFSSVQEGLPVAAVEALMLGTPMVVSDIPPLLEVTRFAGSTEHCAAVFDTGNAADLAQTVIKLVNNPAELETLGKLAANETRRSFGIDAHLARLREIYEEMLDTP